MPVPFAIETLFQEIAVLLLLAAGVGLGALLLRQPLIAAFIAVGILAGPAGFGVVHSSEPLDLLAQMGISVLLFVVGLKLDLHLIRTMGPVALATGIGQVVFTSVVGYFLCLALGMDHLNAVYVAVALTFSSTIIIVKLLSDKREIDALHGRIAVGFLIVQDVVVVLAMIALSAFGTGVGDRHLGIDVAVTLAKGVGLVALTWLLMRHLLPALLHRIARAQELLVLTAITLAVVMAGVGDLLGFSEEVGAFLAGVAVASTPYRDAVASRLVTLRDFLLLFFFIELGAKLDLGLLGVQVLPATVLSLFVLIGNPLIVMAVMGYMGYRKRTSFLAGLTVAQISEFSLVLAALGLSLGHIGNDAVGLVTLVGLITIGLSTYLILYSHPIYERLAPLLGRFERAMPYREQGLEGEAAGGFDVIVFGLGRFGSTIAHGLRERGHRVLGVDFDPQVVAAWRRHQHDALYGDAEDPEFAATLPLGGVCWIVSTIAEPTVNSALVHGLRNGGYPGAIALTAHSDHDFALVRRLGVELVLRPFADAAHRAVTLLAGDRRAAPRAP